MSKALYRTTVKGFVFYPGLAAGAKADFCAKHSIQDVRTKNQVPKTQ